MLKTIFNVEGMSCGHCVQAVETAVGALPGVKGAVADLAAKTVTVDHDNIQCPPDIIKQAIEEQGFDVIN